MVNQVNIINNEYIRNYDVFRYRNYSCMDQILMFVVEDVSKL